MDGLTKRDTSGEKITVTYFGITDKMVEDGAFIAWYLAGAVAGDRGDCGNPKTAYGTLTLDAPQHANSFEVRFYSKGVLSNEFLIMSVPFAVDGGPVEQPAPPAPEGSMDNFVKINTYVPGQFADVGEGWYLPYIIIAYEYGIMNGKAPGLFFLTGNMTIAEAVTIAARVRSVYNTGAESIASDMESFASDALNGTWYKAYVGYAINKGIIKTGDFTDYNRNITRAEAAAILSRLIKAVPLLGSEPMPS